MVNFILVSNGNHSKDFVSFFGRIWGEAEREQDILDKAKYFYGSCYEKKKTVLVMVLGF